MSGVVDAVRDDPAAVSFTVGLVAAIVSLIAVVPFALFGWGIRGLLVTNLLAVMLSLGVITLDMPQDDDMSMGPGGALVGGLTLYCGYVLVLTVILALFGGLSAFDQPLGVMLLFVFGAAFVYTFGMIALYVWRGLSRSIRWLGGVTGAATRSLPMLPRPSLPALERPSLSDLAAVLPSLGSSSGLSAVSTGADTDRGDRSRGPPPGSASTTADSPTAESLADGDPTATDRAAAEAAASYACVGLDFVESQTAWTRYQAVATREREDVAIVAADSSFDREEFEGSLRRSFRTWANVSSHPNALPLRDWSLDPWPWAVHAVPRSDETLADCADTLSSAELIAVVTNTCEVLHTAQRYNRQHGGLRPSLIAMGPEHERGRVQVFGWGVMRTLARGCGVDTVSPFTPPEQLDSPDSAGPTTDVYRLGAVTYWGLTGARPFEVPDTLERAIRAERRVPPTERDGSLPHALDDVLETALAIDGSERYDSPHEFRRALTRAVRSRQ